MFGVRCAGPLLFVQHVPQVASVLPGQVTLVVEIGRELILLAVVVNVAELADNSALMFAAPLTGALSPLVAN